MRYDAEIATAKMVADYLISVVDDDMQEVSPIVTFFDPMSIDEANRVVVRVPSAVSQVESPGNSYAVVECGVKSRWKQPSLKADFDKHFERVNEVRDKLMPADLMDRLNAEDPDGFELDFVQPKREFYTTVTTDGWIYSECKFAVNCLATNN